MTDYAAIVEFAVRRLVAEPDAVAVDTRKAHGAMQIEVTVAPNDVGKVIGRSGRVINSLRHFVGMVAAKSRQKVYVKVLAN
jgi:predicted RNA-binding protein YlqC (UPF0109 family)